MILDDDGYVVYSSSRGKKGRHSGHEGEGSCAGRDPYS